MSEKKSSNEKEQAASDVASEIVTADSGDGTSDTGHDEDAVIAEQPAARPRRKSGGNAVAWLALLLAAGALAAFGYEKFIVNRADPAATRMPAELDALQSSMAAVRDSLSTLEQSVSTLSELDESRNNEISALRRQLAERLQQLENLPGRIASIEANVSSLQGVSTGARDAWLLAESEYYLQIANAQLQLAGNPELATLALTMADERIVQLADPGLVEVRRALARELRALNNMRTPDTEGISLTLASLANSVDALPLRHEIVLPTAADSAIDGELSGFDRAMASLRNALSDVVSVRRSDETLKPLIAPEAQYFLRQNLALQFQAARLAVLRNEEDIFNSSLDDAAAWLEEYYDTGDSAVQSAQQTISDIRGSVFSIAVPDISESLRLLRQFNAFSAATSESRPVDILPAAEEEPVDTETDQEPQQ